MGVWLVNPGDKGALLKRADRAASFGAKALASSRLMSGVRFGCPASRREGRKQDNVGGYQKAGENVCTSISIGLDRFAFSGRADVPVGGS
jgi:hypothetical protein